MKAFTILFITISILFGLSCSSGAKRIDLDKDLLSDTGGLTRAELETAAQKLAIKVGDHFKNNPKEEGIFVAFLPTKNDTYEQISTDIFDNTFTQQLLQKGIYTVKIKNRKEALKELVASQSGITSNPLSAGNLKSPNFFIQCKIDENRFSNKGDKIVEQNINLALISVETTLVVWSDKITYRKQARSNQGVTW